MAHEGDESCIAREEMLRRDGIFQIPPKERDRNPNLTQNTPWL